MTATQMFIVVNCQIQRNSAEYYSIKCYSGIGPAWYTASVEISSIVVWEMWESSAMPEFSLCPSPGVPRSKRGSSIQQIKQFKLVWNFAKVTWTDFWAVTAEDCNSEVVVEAIEAFGRTRILIHYPDVTIWTLAKLDNLAWPYTGLANIRHYEKHRNLAWLWK